MFMNDVSVVVRRMRMYAERSMKVYGIGFPEQMVLMYLGGYGPSNQESIAQHYNLDKGSIAKTIGKLESKGLVERTVNEKNRREKIVELTDAANEVMAEMANVFEGWSAAAFKGISDEDRAVMERVLAQVAKNASALTDEDHS